MRADEIVLLHPTPHEKGWRSTADEVWGREPICLNCGVPWPCEVSIVQTENERLREACGALLSAYDTYIDTDDLDALALAVGGLRAVLSGSSPVE